MFDAVCIKCGRLTDDDSLVYCSEACEAADHAVLNNNYNNNDSTTRHQHNHHYYTQRRSRSRSSGSSVFVSPYLAPGPTGAYMPDIPPLLLPKKRTTSSSASSDVTSVFEYDDNESNTNAADAVDVVQAKSDNMFHLPPLGVSETQLGDSDFENSTSPSVSLKMARRTPISALPFNFARRPAPSDNRALAPTLHTHAQIHLQLQAKSHPSPSSRTLVQSATAVLPPDTRLSSNNNTPPTPTLKTKRSRTNRASLPAYFSQLTLSAHSKPSPPTLAHINVHVDVSSDKLMTPRAVIAPHHFRGRSDQMFFGRKAEDSSHDLDHVPPARTHALPVPGLLRRPVGVSESPRRERGRSRAALGISPERRYKIHDEVERRGRSRVVTPRRVLT